MWTTRKLTDKPQILSFLETDRLYAAYAIGDLEPGMFAQSTWAGAERDGRMEALALYYTGLKPPALFLMGDADGLRAILEDALCPEWVYLTCRPRASGPWRAIVCGSRAPTPANWQSCTPSAEASPLARRRWRKAPSTASSPMAN